jgi:hypothetical protein
MNASWEQKYKYTSACNDEVKGVPFQDGMRYNSGCKNSKGAMMVLENFMEYL